MTSPLAEPQMIDQDAVLADCCIRWQQLPFVALDTEFVRTETFFPVAGLIQVGDGSQSFLIDPLAITDWQPFAALLRNPDVVKVLHACSEDLEVFYNLCGDVPAPLFDTQLAAAYLGMDFSMGYSRLVQQLLGIELPKEETRSDWLQRPLSAAQITYAAGDTQYLAEIYALLAPRLDAAGLTDWLLADTADQVAASNQIQDPQTAYQQIKQAWRLKPSELAILQVLCAWREEVARAQDVARNRLLREKALCPLAQRQPDSLQALSTIEDMHPRTVRQHGSTLLELIRQGAQRPAQEWPERLPEPLPATSNKMLKALRQVGQQHAERLGMAPELMLKKKVLEALIRTGYPRGPYQLPDELTGWRRRLMGDELLQVASRFATETA